MPKLTLIVNSHSLSNFQICEKKYEKEQEQLLVPKVQTKDHMEKGSIIHELLAIYYKGIQEKTARKLIMQDCSDWFKSHYDQMQINPMKMGKEELTADGVKDFLYMRFIEYVAHYANESPDVIAVEQGFSRILYESPNVLYVYEGRPDLIFKTKVRRFLDHKTQSRRYNHQLLQNQFISYAWALNARDGFINYIGLQKEVKPKETFRRLPFSYTSDTIKEWKEVTIQWCYKILMAKKRYGFLKNFAACEGKFSHCPFVNICKERDENIINSLTVRDFKVGEPYRSWE